MEFKKIEEKWQKTWEDKKTFIVTEKGKKFFCLEMFPYPSGEGIHMGHTRNYAIGDCFVRFKRLQGFNVLYPMGYDSFGLPAENAAIKRGVDPKEWTLKNIKLMESQQRRLGFSYDWSRKVITCDPNYYKWNQWIFLKFLENGLAYKKKSEVNYCSHCDTVLANEQVISGKCWRCKTEVEIKILDQWYFKITKYADELLKGLEEIDWPENVKTMQRNWIGKSHGIEVNFKIDDEIMPIFTTRPDTLFGVTFVVFAPEHPKVKELVKGTKYEKKVEDFIKESRKEDFESKEKNGLFIGKYAINPVNNEKVPIYIANFVLLEYGTGFIMAVPAHDQRDFEFAKKYKIPIKVVIQPKDKKLKPEEMKQAFVEEGIMVNSGKFNGLNSKDAIEKISDYLEENNLGKRTVNYKLKDWCISRQRYWGTPIPIIYCDKCGIVPVPEKDLPVLLPENIKFTKGNPLENVKEFVNTKCPKCNGNAKRETDTMDTFVDSSWYFFRYCSPDSNEIFDKEKVKYWMPVDFYVGGIEHATGHLIYSRFFTKVFADLGLIDFREPFKKLLTQGMVTLGGYAMSKSRGNVVDPIEFADKYSADAARLFILSAALPEKELEWSDKGAQGSFRLIKKIYGLLNLKAGKNIKDRIALSKLNKTIKDITSRLENYEFSLAIVLLNDFINYIYRNNENVSEKVLEEIKRKIVYLINPFTPYLSEEMGSKLNLGIISIGKWPEVDESKIQPKLEAEEDFISHVISDIEEIKKLSKIRPRKISIFVSPAWKYEIYKMVFENKEFKEIMMVDNIKKYGNEAKKYYQKLEKKKPLEEIFLTASAERTALIENKDFLEKEFKCEIEIKSAEKIDHPKAKIAEPRKPGILIE